MMIDLQKLIKETKGDISDAQAFVNKMNLGEAGDFWLKGVTEASENTIQRLTLLLNEQPEAITEDAHFRKHDVDGRAESKSLKHSGSNCASSSETAAVDGHEQTNEDCNNCKFKNYSTYDDPCRRCEAYNRWVAI